MTRLPLLLLLACATPAAAGDWTIALVGDAPATGNAVMRFDADGGVSGSTGCNRFQTRAVFDGAGIKLEAPVAMTRMACVGAALTAQEDALVRLLEDRIAVSYNPFAGEMVLSRGDVWAVLTPAEPSDDNAMRPHGGLDRPAGDPPYLAVFGLADPLDIRAAPSADAPALAAVQSGTVLRNLGCSDQGGKAWCNVALLSGEPAGWAPQGNLEPAGPALRAGQDAFDATGMVPCSKGKGAPTWPCNFGVARGAGGAAAVVVRRHDGMERVLFFENGEFVSTDSSQAGGGFDTAVTRDGDLSLIRIDDERYEIPDAVVLGG